VVTLPGEFMRGRQTMAMLRLMGLDQLIAADIDDYVANAIEVASNRGMNESIREMIAERRSNIFDCENASTDFAAKIIGAVAAQAGR
jgi:predicted O-linked N-acetylglucosamine transferase (SPINDLY family)